MPTSCPICGACNADEICSSGGRYEPGCPIKAELDEFDAERAAERAAEIRAGIMLVTDGQADGQYSNGGPIADHPHDSAQEWQRCKVCGLAKAAHDATSGTVQAVGTYRCPWCVDQGIEVCSHCPKGALAMDGAKL